MDIKKIETLQKDVSDEIQRRKEGQLSAFNHLAVETLKQYNERLTKIKKILSISNYTLVFIGKVGAGKTTAICRLFDLMRDVEANIPIKGKTKNIHGVQELLTTGSGHTTLCEVVIKSAQETFIEVEPHDKENVSQFLKDFCYHIWMKVYPNNDGGTVSTVHRIDIPSELMRAIRNIVKLYSKKVDKTDKDEALELAKSFKENQFQDFYKKVLALANLSQRIKTKILLPSTISNLSEQKAWIQKHFDYLNLAKISTCSIPNKIIIHLNSDILDFEQCPRLKTVIDTRGTNSTNQTRKDLDDYIKRDDTICLFTEKFPESPNNVIDLISNHLTPESQHLDTKSVLFVMPRNREPENVVSSESGIEGQSREDGIAFRTREIEDTFAKCGIKFLPDNIVFYDALEYYHSVPNSKLFQLDTNYDKDDVEAVKQSTFDDINKVITTREKALWQEVHALENIFSAIKNGSGLINAKDEQLISDVKALVEKKSYFNFSSAEDFPLLYENIVKKRHHQVLRATNSMYGKYKLRHIDVCYDAVPIIKSMLRKLMQTQKNDIVQTIDSTLQYGSDDLQNLMKFFTDEINSYYEALINHVTDYIYLVLERDFFYREDSNGNHNEFWLNTQKRWRAGLGYKVDIAYYYTSKLENTSIILETKELEKTKELKGISAVLEYKTKEFWETEFIGKILTFFSQ